MTRALVALLAIASPAFADEPAIPQVSADHLNEILQDPSIKVKDPQARATAQALMTEGVRRLHGGAYVQALANFLDAYDKVPSPKILLDIASTLHDMGRLADAANTYNRYLVDPDTGAEHVAEVKQLLMKLDGELTILVVRVFPRGSEVSIDAGPFVPVGSSLLTRVRPGIHLVRVRRGDASSEVSINGFEGERKEVAAALKVQTDLPTPATPRPPPIQPGALPIETELPDTVEGWLVTGTTYTSAGKTTRRVHDGYAGPVVVAVLPVAETSVAAATPSIAPAADAGVIGIVRLDGKGRGFAGGLGLAYAPIDPVVLEMAVLKSALWGVYAGARVRLMPGRIRPYVSGGGAVFEYPDDAMQTHVAPGVHGAGGIELALHRHLALDVEIAVEHFFGVDPALYDPTVIVPTIGVVGRL
jgi:hypothetical protein